MLKNIKIILFIILVSMFLFSCKRDPNILFCEGLTTDGKGKNCGTVFTSGDLTAIIKRANGFGSNSVTVNVYEKRNHLKLRVDSVNIEVGNTDTVTNTNLSFYNTGVFEVEATVNDAVFAKYNITIQD
jgi:hypothetical protein